MDETEGGIESTLAVLDAGVTGVGDVLGALGLLLEIAAKPAEEA